MRLLFLLFALMFAFAISEEEKCCEACTVEGEVKYYSVDKLFNRCGECCMNPKDYWKYKIFEFSLTKATVDNPCEELGYGTYEKTETHGILSLKITLDKYKPTEK